MNNKYINPLPEIAHGELGEGWEICNLTEDDEDWEEDDIPNSKKPACVDKIRKKLYVPMGMSEADIFSRAHEIGHILISPDRPPKILPKNIELASEDVRVNYFLYDKGVDTSNNNGLEILKTVTSVEDLFLKGASVSFTGSEEAIKSIVKEIAPGISKEYNSLIKTVKKIAQKLGWENENTSKEIGRVLKKYTDAASEKRRNGGRGPLSKLANNFPNNSELQQKLEKFAKGVIVPGESMSDTNSPAGVPWGTMRIDSSAPRIINIPEYKANRKNNIAIDEGSIFRYPHRVLEDGKVFAKKKKTEGLSVLVDCSGSMSIRESQIKSVLSKVPGATIAGYSARSKSGVLRIFAKDGKRVEDKHITAGFCGVANVIDLPALKWLAKLPMPRLWVSDGYVSGIGDRPSYINCRDVDDFIHKNSILRIGELGTLEDVLKSKPNGGKITKNTAGVYTNAKISILYK